jgi:hypothetical protein
VTDLVALVRGLGARRDAGPATLVAVGWATVDLERTLADLGDGSGATVVDEPLLGARAARVDAGGMSVVVLEPVTEGRLAAALARRGEGICALYVAAHGPTPVDAVRTTALGLPGRLVSQGQPWGPFVIEAWVEP